MALQSLKFVDAAYSSVAKMHAAMVALAKDAAAVQGLAQSWGIKLTIAEAQELVDEFNNVQSEPISEIRVNKAC